VLSKIKQIKIIISPQKEIIKKYFLRDYELENFLHRCGKSDQAQRLAQISQQAEISFEYQYESLGSAHAVSLAKSFVDNQPFVLCMGDDVVFGDIPAAKQLIDAYDKVKKTIIGVQVVDGNDIVRYGVIKTGNIGGKIIECKQIIEKPLLNNIPSRYACMGRYVLTEDIFDTLKYLTPASNGEYLLPDCINMLVSNGVFAYCFDGKRYDMGNKLDATKAIFDFAINSSEYGADFRNYVAKIIK